MQDFHQHEMQLKQTYPSGVEEWFCPTCGRRFLMRWPPQYKKVVLDAGDEYAIHTGGKGGLAMSAPTVGPAEPSRDADAPAVAEEMLDDDTTADLVEDADLLGPWLKYFEESDPDDPADSRQV